MNLEIITLFSWTNNNLGLVKLAVLLFCVNVKILFTRRVLVAKVGISH